VRLVISYAKRYLHHGIEFLDLIQIGNLGLMRALEKYDDTKNTKFSTYAYRCIYNEIAGFIYEEMKMTHYSLNTQIYQDNEDSPTWEEHIMDKVDIILDYEKQEEYQVLWKMIHDLSEVEKEILLRFYGLIDGKPLSISAIGRELNVSRTYVTLRKKAAEKKIKEKLKERGFVYPERNKINEEELLLRYQNELAGLSLTNQRVIAMYLEGYTLLEIAIQTNKSPRTVYSQLDSSIDKLQKQGQDEVVLKLQMKRKKRKGSKMVC